MNAFEQKSIIYTVSCHSIDSAGELSPFRIVLRNILEMPCLPTKRILLSHPAPPPTLPRPPVLTITKLKLCAFVAGGSVFNWGEQVR